MTPSGKAKTVTVTRWSYIQYIPLIWVSGYVFFGYKGNFWVDPNGMGIYTIEYFGFKG